MNSEPSLNPTRILYIKPKPIEYPISTFLNMSKSDRIGYLKKMGKLPSLPMAYCLFEDDRGKGNDVKVHHNTKYSESRTQLTYNSVK